MWFCASALAVFLELRLAHDGPHLVPDLSWVNVDLGPVDTRVHGQSPCFLDLLFPFENFFGGAGGAGGTGAAHTLGATLFLEN